MVLEAGAKLTHTTLTESTGNPLRRIAVNVIINSLGGALCGRHICNLSYVQGAIIGATVTLVKAIVAACICKAMSYDKHYITYSLGGSITLASWGLTHARNANLPNFNQNLRNASVIVIFTETLTTLIDHIAQEKVRF